MSISAISPNHKVFGNTKNINNLSKNTSSAKNAYVEEVLPRKQKGIILASSIAGTLAAFALCGRAQKLNIFKFQDLKKIDIGIKEIFGLTAGSLVGGLTAGLVVDKNNRKDKIRESLQQLVGNIIFPISFVSGANAIYKKLAGDFKMPKVKNKYANAIIQALPTVAVTTVGLISGIIVGNKVANEMNNKLFKANEDRDVKVSDFAAHVDDTLLGASLVAKQISTSPTNLVGAAAAKLIPPALVVPGYMTGIATGNPPEVEEAQS